MSKPKIIRSLLPSILSEAIHVDVEYKGKIYQDIVYYFTGSNKGLFMMGWSSFSDNMSITSEETFFRQLTNFLDSLK